MNVVAAAGSTITHLLDARLRAALSDGWTIAVAANAWTWRANAVGTSRRGAAGGSETDQPGLAVAVWIEDGWLRFDAEPALAADPRTHAARLLARSGRCATAAKLAVDAAGRLRVRAELPIGSLRDPDLTAGLLTVERLRETATGIVCLARDESALGVATAMPQAGRAERADAAGAPDPDTHSEAMQVADEADAALCADAGWEYVLHADGALAVELPVAGSFCQALVARAVLEDGGRLPSRRHRHAHACDDDGRAALRISTVLDVPDDASDTCRAAVEAMMLRANGWVRLIRASRLGRRPTLEAWLGTAPTAGELAEALTAMTTAARWCARSAEALAVNRATARAYLAALSHDAGHRPHGDDARAQAPPSSS